MPLKHYLDHYDDSESASCVPQAKEENFTPREFAETGYIPVFVVREGIMFDACLTIQKEKFIYDIFRRVYELFGEDCPYSSEEFDLEQYEAGEQVKISVIALPRLSRGTESLKSNVGSRSTDSAFIRPCRTAR